VGTSQKVVWVFGIGSVTYKIYFIEFLFIIKYKPIGAAPRGHFFVGGGRGRLGKKVVTLRGLRISEKIEILRKPTVL
jgi:hypothetical protein